MRILQSLFLLLACCSATSAQVIHPNQYATTEGSANNNIPFNWYPRADRCQQSYEAAQFPGPMQIGRIGFRIKDDSARAAGITDCQITLSYLSGSWDTLSPTFATNVGASPTVVFDGQATIPAFNGDPATPNPFHFVIDLTTLFDYDPSQGDLLVDMTFRNASTVGAFARSSNDVGVNRVYGTGTSGSSASSGLITLFDGPPCPGSAISSGSGCNDSTGTTVSLSPSGCAELGSSFGLQLSSGAIPNGIYLLNMGISDQLWLGIQLPLDLSLFGAPGCNIYQSQDASVGPAPAASGSFLISTTIPNDPSLTLGTTFWQGFLLDPAANQIGLASSNLLALTIG